MIFLGIIVAFIVFSTVVLIHEIGHFFAARFFGVKVEEFGLGIPPRAKEIFTDKKGTIFSLNWLPLGGFVKLYGENQELLKDKDDKKALYNKSSFAQIIIILAGVFMNFVLAFVIFSILFFIGVKPVGINTQIKTTLDLKLIPNYEQAINSGLLEVNSGVILSPVKNSIAEKSGVKSGDILIGVGIGNNILSVNNPLELKNIISNNKDKEIILKINRNSVHKDVKVHIDKNGKIGTYIGENIEINKDFMYKFSFLGSIKYGFLETKNQILLTFKGLNILVQKIFNPKDENERKQVVKDMSGPIGIVDFISNSLSAGIIFIIFITAIISINLGVFNLLPIPALDGGRFFLISINSLSKAIFSKKIINQNIENYIHLFFFIFLIVLSLIIGYNDIIKIISK